jgi:hypothetical protein
MPALEVKNMLGYLYGGKQGLEEVRRIDAKIDSLPGRRNLHLLQNQPRRHGVLAA